METPKGFRTYLFEQSSLKREIEYKFNRLFLKWGYKEIIPPKIDFFDTLAAGASESISKEVFKFTDRESGKILALRSDITPQIARTTAIHLKKSAKPLRLSYCDNVFRHVEPRSGGRQELTQAGVELIGVKSPAADAEIIAIAITAIQELGFCDFTVTVGQVDFFKGILSGTGLSVENRKEVQRLIQKKDVSGLSVFLDQIEISNESKKRLVALPSLIGGEDILEKAKSLCDGPISLSAIDDLMEISRNLKMYGVDKSVLFDLGEVRGLAYYTGVCFEGFIKGMGREICGGGRYDNLLGIYGDPSPATGFAVDIDTLLDLILQKNISQPLSAIDYQVIDYGLDKKEGIDLILTLRNKGKKVIRDISFGSKADSLSYARDKNIVKSLFLNADKLEDTELVEIETSTGNEQRMTIKEFLCRLK